RPEGRSQPRCRVGVSRGSQLRLRPISDDGLGVRQRRASLRLRAFGYHKQLLVCRLKPGHFIRILSQSPDLTAQLHQLTELIAGKSRAVRLSDELRQTFVLRRQLCELL